MKLYHGTQDWRARSIEQEGFQGSELSELTSLGTFVEDGVIFLADSIEEAREYGDAIFEVDAEGHETFFQVSPLTGKSNEYTIPVAIVEAELIYERVE